MMRDGTWTIEDVRRGQWSALERERRLLQMTQSAAGFCNILSVYVEQEPGSGGKESAEASVRMLKGFRAYADKVTGSKEVRAEPYAAQVQGGNVALVAGSFISWCPFLD
jgi:phage terminase large subunit-like protein